ncbi:hypothetical protein FHT32_004230 [Variovorax sp. SG517]|uniref:hypothetical protein n=1 Tax=Variovorax sp. SG517 TaxID=2587117 RepID=UPI00159E952E|nr:hypothetical protein [Variovorax sp. SG517]NVM90573.1 hypothetical protein [Variovorax sp. SG517]
MKTSQTALAYALDGHDDGSYMLGNETYKPDPENSEWRFGSMGQPHPATCRGCGGKLESDYTNPGYRVRKRRRDITATHDGYLLVSAHLRKVLQESGATREDFVALPADPDYFWLRPQMTLPYSAAERARRCSSCGRFADEVVPIPLFLRELVQPLAAGVYRSCLEFGSAPLKAFQVVIGVRTALTIQSNSLVGIELEQLCA